MTNHSKFNTSQRYPYVADRDDLPDPVNMAFHHRSCLIHRFTAAAEPRDLEMHHEARQRSLNRVKVNEWRGEFKSISFKLTTQSQALMHYPSISQNQSVDWRQRIHQIPLSSNHRKYRFSLLPVESLYLRLLTITWTQSKRGDRQVNLTRAYRRWVTMGMEIIQMEETSAVTQYGSLHLNPSLSKLCYYFIPSNSLSASVP